MSDNVQIKWRNTGKWRNRGFWTDILTSLQSRSNNPEPVHGSGTGLGFVWTLAPDCPKAPVSPFAHVYPLSCDIVRHSNASSIVQIMGAEFFRLNCNCPPRDGYSADFGQFVATHGRPLLYLVLLAQPTVTATEPSTVVTLHTVTHSNNAHSDSHQSCQKVPGGFHGDHRSHRDDRFHGQSVGVSSCDDRR